MNQTNSNNDSTPPIDFLPDFEFSLNTEEGKIEKYRVRIHKDLRSVKGTTFENCLFLKETFFEMTFTDCVFINCKFSGCRFNDIEFHSCKIYNTEFWKPRFDKTYIDPRSIKFDALKWAWLKSNINTTLFQKLESNFKNIHQDDFAMIAHIRFRRYKIWQDIYSIRNSKNLLEPIRLSVQVLLALCYDLFLTYGYGLLRAFIVTAVLIYFGLDWIDENWTQLGIQSTTLDLNKTNSLQKLYFLIVTSSTLGYGDITPTTPLGMKTVICIVLASVLWTATITALFVKRLIK